jgi:hypothetical protein
MGLSKHLPPLGARHSAVHLPIFQLPQHFNPALFAPPLFSAAMCLLSQVPHYLIDFSFG